MSQSTAVSVREEDKERIRNIMHDQRIDTYRNTVKHILDIYENGSNGETDEN